MRLTFVVLALVAGGASQSVVGQTLPPSQLDSVPSHLVSVQNRPATWHPAVLRVAVPLGLVGAAYLGCRRDNMVYEMRAEVQEETREAFPRGLRTDIDDYTRHAPVAAAYVMHLAGMKPARGVAAFTICYGLARTLNNTVVSQLKKHAAISRPDNPADLSSFPSSHTAEAFMTATLLHEQFGRERPWVSVGGYAVATATGALRMMHNRHWITDVVAGAGVGFLSAETVWRLYPKMARLVPGKLGQKLVFLPTYMPGGALGVTLAVK